ncbi:MULTISPECIES: DUF2924 domain-containing protein [Methyloceanibacter]|uniref:DUF2924 domain-containing protein n=1 Tax=Methyloceanibacter TaxID=1484898 RepID=UPI0009E50281|nr:MULTISPECIES: DUF2924 domain-containing protein [Methyloceanibacter]
MSRPQSPHPRPQRRGRVSAQAEADLVARVNALPDCPRAELEAEWRRLWSPHVPHHASRAFLVRAVAYGLQAEVYGGLDSETRRLLKKAGQTNGKSSRPQRRRLSKGSKLFREWHGETHEVLVLDKDFAWRGETYPSLSAIARAITGTNWNGWAFFGLKRRTKEAPADD